MNITGFWLEAFGFGGDGVGAIGQEVGQEESQGSSPALFPYRPFSQHLLERGVYLELGILAGEARGKMLRKIRAL